ncbi:hypothetical protein GCM10023221_12460 [Luteimicrobium xylanilyticum]|uniref:Poly(Glycerol-phosphate) alpha-glucosyltransferase n=1 Tax=Luteimicrobium xylanilyticum TaxID=1133546 RepID=A0A5P9QCV6_9MICO|nr:glycosyltransferase family 4 protein [Luteimicrobium xylanilyticum]QFU99281.1 Poly(glycerol-phosphate) alpha-glucosyltransferase [Luteimicrobium xylanilyticum]
MKVLHVVDSDRFAGVERHVARLARGQAAAGYRVVVLGGAAAPVSLEAGPDVRHATAVGLLQTSSQVRRYADGADVVHVHMTAAEVATALARVGTRHRPPVVSTRHFALRRGSGPLGPVVARVAGAVVDHQIAISEFTADAVEGPSTVVLAGVDRQPDAQAASDRERRVLLVQRLEEEKRADLGIEAFARSGLATQGWSLHVVGEGALRPDLESLAERLLPTGVVRFTGRVDDVPRVMRDAALMIAPTPGEHFGLSVLEAMSAGLPVVADGSGGHLETLGRVSGAALYHSLDADDAARLLRALAGNAGARDAYAQAEQARQRADFTLDAQVAATDAVYRSVL